MGRQRYLDDLRERNNGYNPEKIEAVDHLKVVRLQPRHAVVKNDETGMEEVWTKSEAETEADYIEKWPRQYAIVINGRFYYKAS